MGGLLSLNRVFKLVLNLASYTRYCLSVLLKTGLSTARLGVIKGARSPFLMNFDTEILCDL